MKKQFIIGLLFLLIMFGSCDQMKKGDSILLAPKENRRPENFQPFNYKYSLEELKDNFSYGLMQLAKQRYERVKEVNQKGKWKSTLKSINSHRAPEWLEDAKFGMFIDWGLWSVAGWAPKRKEGAMYPDWYEFRLDTDTAFVKYHNKNWGKDFERDDFIPLFVASNYEPNKLVDIAKEAGMKYIIPFCKHHSGFCLWPSSFTQRDAYDMGPKKDLIEPLVESCKEQDLKFGFYFSVDDWEYPIINNDGNLVNRKWGNIIEPYSEDLEKKASGKIPVKNFAEDYIVPQATEFIDKYDPDILWYDGEWNTTVNDLLSYDITAYFYNNADGRKKVAVNDRIGLAKGDPYYETLPGSSKDKERGWLRFISGDIFTSEFHDHDDLNTTHFWEANRGISQSFGYNWQDTEDNVISSKEFIQMFVDIVSNGGNLLLIVNLDGQGSLPKIQETRLLDIGKWMQVNGEGIYNTRMYSTKSEGIVNYTRSKDNKTVFAIATEWPGKQLKLKSVTPKEGSQIYLLGMKKALKWHYNQNEGLTIIEIPDNLQKEINRPCKYSYTFKIKI